MATDVEGTQWRCPECGKPHARDDPPCDNCGYRQFERAVVRDTGQRSSPAVEWQCAECGTRHVKNAPPCKRCGNMQFESVAFEYESEMRPTADDLASRAYRPLLALTLGVPVYSGLLSVVIQRLLPAGAFAGAFRELAILTLLPVVVAVLVVPVLLYLDASTVRAADLRWDPSPLGYAVATAVAAPLVLAPVPFLNSGSVMAVVEYPFETLGVASTYVTLVPPVVALDYLYRRHYFVRDAAERADWWLLLPATVVVGLGAAGLGAVAPTFEGDVLAVARVVSLAFPVAAYLDASYVRTVGDDWTPNPVVHFGLATVTILVFPGTLLYVLYAGYYLSKRRRHVGLEPVTSENRADDGTL